MAINFNRLFGIIQIDNNTIKHTLQELKTEINSLRKEVDLIKEENELLREKVSILSSEIERCIVVNF